MMKRGGIYSILTSAQKKNRCLFAVLVDPDKFVPEIYKGAAGAGVSLFLVGGSLLSKGSVDDCIEKLKKEHDIPVALFPGHSSQFSDKADAIFLLSLISGRNPDYLIGQHVQSAHAIRNSGIDVIPTGYVLIGGGGVSGTQYITGTQPVPSDKPELAIATALAGELLGLRSIYLEAGSGSSEPVSADLVKKLKKTIGVPIICGGGISTGSQARSLAHAGCSMIVVGNGIEKKPSLLFETGKALKGS